jgi:signal peptidase I
MRPFINSDEVVILRKVSPESLKRGDIIYFTSSNGPSVMHRIISKTRQPGNKISFTTKGDALLQNDEPISQGQVLGKAIYVEKTLPLIGALSVNLDSGFCKSLNAVYGLYRKARQKFLNRSTLRKIFPSIQ